MHKLIKRYLYGGISGANTSNIGFKDLNLLTPVMDPKLSIPSSLGSTFESITGPFLKLTDGLSFFGSNGISSSFSKPTSYTTAKHLGLTYGDSEVEGGGNSNINFLKSLIGNKSGLVLMGASIINSLLPNRITSGTTDTINGIFDIAKNIPGGEILTLGLTLFNTIDSLGASKLAEVKNDLSVTDTLARTGGGYENFINQWNKAKDLSGQRVGLFTNKNSLNNKIYDANYKMAILQNIIGKKRTADLLTALMGDIWNERTMIDMNGGPGNISFGRLGLKIEILDKVHSILNKPKVVDSLTEFEEEIPEFKEGGKMNVIPEGSLHARLHHMENADGLTKKGIPVVSIAEGGELEQQAEIELNEIIFRLEVTQELEKLMEDGSDNAAIEAGKLLVKEIFENTDDRTGLLKLLEPEKKEPTTEEIVKNHQVF